MAEEVDAVLVVVERLLDPPCSNLLTLKTWSLLQKLRGNLRHFAAFFKDTAGLIELALVRQIKEVAYDLEDVLESSLIAFTTDSIINRRWFKVKEQVLAREIESISHGRLYAMYRWIPAYLDPKLTAEADEVWSEQLYKEVSSITPCNIFEDEAEALIRNLMAETAQLDVISITGMPGIGKTTLARTIFHNETIVSYFPTRIWVDIPLYFNWKHVFLKIVEGFNSHDILQMSERKTDDELRDDIRTYLEKSSRFLLVMDSVWTADSLDSIIHFLPKNGKVLITSRHNHISRKPHHYLRFLNDKESWELLQLAVFGKVDVCSEMLKSTGECIAKNCDGSPLAIALVANGLMIPPEEEEEEEVGKDLTEKWWKKVSENVTQYLTDYSAQYDVFKSIQLSYTILPRRLQNCFLYLGMFPEGCEIPVWTLTRLWIAERLVEDSGDLSSEKIAEQCLDELIERNLVLVGKIYPNGQIRTCRLHKLMYGFCKYKADEKEFYHEIKISKGGALDRPMPLAPNHRRLCIQSCLSEFLSTEPEGPSVRSILCLDNEVLHSNYTSNIHKSFKLLKILECKRIKFAKFPTKLSRLKNLRYIALSCDDLEFIPEAISSLRLLETLVVYTQSAFLELKANIWRMPQLQHLVTKAAIVLAIRQGKGEAGKNLRTLTRLSPACCTEDVFEKVSDLKTLGIRGRIADIPAAGEVLRKLESLENLKMINESAAADLPLSLTPNFFPPNIRRLTLSGTHLEWELMSVLGKIDSLEILKLKNNAFKGASWNTDVGGFRGLGFLFIGTTDLVSWEVSSANCFRKLRWLVLNNCEMLEKIPSTLAIGLDTLEVHNVSESAVESAKQSEWEKVKVHGL